MKLRYVFLGASLVLFSGGSAYADPKLDLTFSSKFTFDGYPIGGAAASTNLTESVDSRRWPSKWERWLPWIVGGGTALLIAAVTIDNSSSGSSDSGDVGAIDTPPSVEVPVTPPGDVGGGDNPGNPSPEGGGGNPSNDPPTVNSGIASVDSQDRSGIEASQTESIQAEQGVFFSTAFSQARKRQTDQSRASRQHSHSLTLGYDRLFTSHLNAGAFFDLSTASTTVPESADTNDSPSRSLYAFADMQLRATTNVSGYIGVSRHENSQLRYAALDFSFDNGSGGGGGGGGNTGPVRLTANSTVNQSLAGLAIAQQLPSWRQVQADVQLGVDYTQRQIDAYQETGDVDRALAFAQRVEDSLITRLSLSLTRALSTQRGVLVPQLGFEYQNESRDDSRRIEARPVSMNGGEILWQTDEPDRHFGSITAGFVWVAPAGVQIYADINTLVQHRFRNSTRVNIGARIEL